MRRKLTALMALLMLAGAGMIAPTATAQEYEGSYVTQLSSDGTITEFIAVMGVTEESCQSTKYKPVYDAKRNACLLGLSFKGERITKAFTLKLTSMVVLAIHLSSALFLSATMKRLLARYIWAITSISPRSLYLYL